MQSTLNATIILNDAIILKMIQSKLNGIVYIKCLP